VATTVTGIAGDVVLQIGSKPNSVARAVAILTAWSPNSQFFHKTLLNDSIDLSLPDRLRLHSNQLSRPRDLVVSENTIAFNLLDLVLRFVEILSIEPYVDMRA